MLWPGHLLFFPLEAGPTDSGGAGRAGMTTGGEGGTFWSSRNVTIGREVMVALRGPEPARAGDEGRVREVCVGRGRACVGLRAGASLTLAIRARRTMSRLSEITALSAGMLEFSTDAFGDRIRPDRVG